MRSTARELSIECPPSMPMSEATLPARNAPFHLVGGEREPERAGVGADEVVDDVYLLHRDADRFLRAERGRDVDGPELAADSALPQPGDVGVELGLVLLDVDFGDGAVHELAVAPRQVVVSVDQRASRRCSARARSSIWSGMGVPPDFRGLSVEPHTTL